MKEGARFEEIAKSFSTKELPESEIELVGDVPADIISPYRETALAQLAGEVDLPGFRKGHVPKDMALKKIGEMALLQEAVELFVRDFYPELIIVKKLDAVGRPNINITKLAPNNPVGLQIRTTIYPTLTLPRDWKDTGKNVPEEMPLPATEEEVDQTLLNLYKSRHPELIPDASVGAPTDTSGLNDEFAKSVGAFENLEALKAQIKKGVTEEKVRKARDTRRGKIIDMLLAKVVVAVPNIFVVSELDKIMAQMREDVARFGLSFEDYLKQMNKTEEALRNEFREQALKRAKLQLTLNKIADEEKIEPEAEAVEHEMKHALEHFPDANPELLKIHVQTVLRNEKVLQLLEVGGA